MKDILFIIFFPINKFSNIHMKFKAHALTAHVRVVGVHVSFSAVLSVSVFCLGDTAYFSFLIEKKACVCK